MRLGRIPGLRQVPPLLRKVEPETVLFESWRGDYSDNPRAISEALQRDRSSVRQLWATEGSRLSPNGRGYLEALGRAEYLVTNVHMPGYFRKKRGSRYVQTWHGTPLKRIGFDIKESASSSYLKNLALDVAKWDLLLSPNRFSTGVFRGAFRYEGEIVETGYPRNDLLSSPDRERIREEARRELGIPSESRAILYAPTWREKGGFSLRLDIERLTAELGDEWRVLFRAHKVDAVAARQAAMPGVIDATTHPDIRDLYLASDVLVTDYSSASFDFAVTGKPMLFFTPDLAEYMKSPGLYIDLASEAPGPLLMTTSDVCEALKEIEDVERAHSGKYASFKSTYCSLEDGKASERAIEAAFRD